MADNELNPVVGIDLGTTFSAIARWHDKKREPRHYQHSKSGDTLQSVVYCDPRTSEILVGKLAYNKGLVDPENVAIGVKRKMDDASEIISIGGKDFSPIDLSAMILKELYQDVVQQFGGGKFKSRATVVAHPYYFKAHQCEHTRKAAEIADINCISLIPEPIAASLAYAWQLVQERPDQEIKQNILVFDLGGGTFDLTLFCLHQAPKKLLFEVLATGGDDRLGGMDFDECLYNLILEKSDISLTGLTKLDERKARRKILEQAIEAKITLSQANDTFVTVPDVLPGQHIDIKVSRQEFEESIQIYTQKIGAIVEKLWAISNLSPPDIHRVILVGGSSRIPCMQALVCERIGKEKVYGNINPSLCVAEGAAMYAAYLDDPEIFGHEIEVRTRTCHALGIEAAGGRFIELISANQPTPWEQRQLFTNDTDNLTSLDINVYQGSSPFVIDNTKIGTLKVSDLPERKAEELEIWVTFKVDREQNLSVTVEVDGDRWGDSFGYA
ncbi:Hsp70 family protein [Pseudanabaena sp. FACHB-1277]|uniref:Hsp70 family protein n=1 Tax=Pseudanabaena cinerea FACHB-1277 TaxID=2949581 RepID=A0A926USL4_9CYAN|nr:Hsp70 family protein [Pseudanabaena cinerea]MBD2150465.1 Hsp70 family protein [Pseudanabaena cinerea FACHB-1277]